jgi:hypothetical protein
MQRIKLRLYKHPVKLDATIVAMDPSGKWIDVEFDGPLPNVRLWQYSTSLLANKEPDKNGLILQECNTYEVV